MKLEDLPTKIPVFPLSNFIIFPKTSVPLNIFEPRYIDMINDSIKSNKLIGMIQPKILSNQDDFTPELYQVGCMGKITSFKETEDGRYLIDLKGIIRFRIMEEINSDKKYRECKIDFQNFYDKGPHPVYKQPGHPNRIGYSFMASEIDKFVNEE